MSLRGHFFYKTFDRKKAFSYTYLQLRGGFCDIFAWQNKRILFAGHIAGEIAKGLKSRNHTSRGSYVIDNKGK